MPKEKKEETAKRCDDDYEYVQLQVPSCVCVCVCVIPFFFCFWWERVNFVMRGKERSAPSLKKKGLR